MQFPLDLVIHGVIIPSHFIFDTLAIALAVRYYTVLRTKEGDLLANQSRLTVMLGATVGALLGAHLLAMWQALHTPLFAELGVLYVLFGGKTIVGALAGGIVGVEVAKKLAGEHRSSGDLLTFPLIYGIMIGRIGCLLTGIADDTAGLPSSLPWAFDQGDGITRHPTAAYEILFLGLLWAILGNFRKKVRLPEGVLFRLFIFSYFSFRILIDFLKPGDVVALGLTAIQITALIFAAWYAFDIVRLIRKKYG